MFRAILVTQWKWTRLAVLIGTVFAFLLPLLAYANARDADSARLFVAATQRWGAAYALLAAALGLLVALAAWQHDHQGRHVYALTLPISRARYVWLRFAAGGTFLLPAIAGLLIGALIVTVSADLPDGLRAYPLALTLRFAFAAAVAYAVFFAIAASTARTAGVILGIIVAVFLSQYMLSVVGADMDILTPIAEFIFARPGILAVFSGRWMLVDV